MGAVTVSLLAHHVKRSIFKNYRRNHRPMVHGAERIVVISIPTKRLVRRLALTTDILVTRDLPAHHLDLRGRTKGLLGMIQRVMPLSPRASLGRTIRLCTKRTPLVNEAGQTCSLPYVNFSSRLGGHVWGLDKQKDTALANAAIMGGFRDERNLSCC